MRGHIRQKSKGSWQITIDTGTGSDGERRRHFETVHSSRKSDAQKRLTELLTSLDKGVYTPPGKLTLATHIQNWLTGYVKTNCSPRTYDGYQSIAEHHIIPALGQYQLKHLHPQIIQAYYGKAVEKLSPRTVAKHHRLLSQALKYAVRQGYLGRNPCEFADSPSWKGKAMRTLTPFEVQVFLDVARDSYYYPVYYTAVSTGLRQAELLGLRWRDVDLDLLSISVNRVLYKRRGVCEVKEPNRMMKKGSTEGRSPFVRGVWASFLQNDVSRSRNQILPVSPRYNLSPLPGQEGGQGVGRKSFSAPC